MATIKNPVGVGKNAVNDVKDVKAIQTLLNHHIYELELPTLRVSGKIDQPTLYAIGKFQKLVAKTSVSNVIEPGSKTLKALLKSPDEDGLREEKVYVFKHRGKEVALSEADYKTAVAAACNSLKPIAAAQLSHYQTIESHEQFYTNAATGASGLMEAIVVWSSSLVAKIPPPQFDGGPRAFSAVRKAQSAIRAQDLKTAPAALREAQIQLDAYAAEVQRYGNKICGGAAKMQAGLEFTRDVSFEIANEIGSAVLQARGMNKAAAKATSGAVFAAIKSSSNQLGRTIAGYKDTPEQKAAAVLVDTVLGGVKGGVGGKYIGKLGDKVAAGIATKPPLSYVGKKVCGDLVVRFCQGAGKQAVDEAFDGVLKAVGDITKTCVIKGKKIDVSAYVTKALTDAVFKVVTGGLLKNVEGATSKAGSVMAASARKQAKNTAFLKKLRLDKNSYFLALKPEKQAEVLKDVLGKAIETPSNEGVKLAWTATIEKLTGGESSDKIAKSLAENAMTNDKFLAAAGREIEKAKKKYAKGK